MAKTVYAEQNQARWQGIRPGIVGDPINRSVVATDVLTILYTVPANKILLLFNSWFFARFSTAAVNASLAIRDDGDALVYTLASVRATVADYPLPFGAVARYIPIEVIAAYDVYVFEDADGSMMSAGIEGVLIDA